MTTSFAQIQSHDNKLALFGRLIQAELYLLLNAPPEDGKITPLTLKDQENPDHAYALIFDSEDALSDYIQGASADYLALSGLSLIHI